MSGKEKFATRSSSSTERDDGSILEKSLHSLDVTSKGAKNKEMQQCMWQVSGDIGLFGPDDKENDPRQATKQPKSILKKPKSPTSKVWWLDQIAGTLTTNTSPLDRVPRKPLSSFLQKICAGDRSADQGQTPKLPTVGVVPKKLLRISQNVTVRNKTTDQGQTIEPPMVGVIPKKLLRISQNVTMRDKTTEDQREKPESPLEGVPRKPLSTLPQNIDAGDKNADQQQSTPVKCIPRKHSTRKSTGIPLPLRSLRMSVRDDGGDQRQNIPVKSIPPGATLK